MPTEKFHRKDLSPSLEVNPIKIKTRSNKRERNKIKIKSEERGKKDATAIQVQRHFLNPSSQSFVTAEAEHYGPKPSAETRKGFMRAPEAHPLVLSQEERTSVTRDIRRPHEVGWVSTRQEAKLERWETKKLNEPGELFALKVPQVALIDPPSMNNRSLWSPSRGAEERVDLTTSKALVCVPVVRKCQAKPNGRQNWRAGIRGKTEVVRNNAPIVPGSTWCWGPVPREAQAMD
ncbi:hypothetical protein BDZ94DRAFT_1238670 [Collybia nuda]|uniref:Uncharacterized protein n=1 Tax=Collybia nuda TaxID=64659 RepID=A0A9P6CFG1_9AGAR|nr:hypothetical protein BDZ94DRAFT_1238670 [Collybia nuda]